METPQSTIENKNIEDNLAAPRIHPLWGLVLSLAALAVVIFYFYFQRLGQIAVAGLIVLLLLLWAYRRPALLGAAMLLVTPFNYGFMAGGATIKLSELVIAAMGMVILFRIAAADRTVIRRLRRTGAIVISLVSLGVLAVVTASPHPNFFNVRYEVQNYIICIFMLAFFRRSWWPRILLLALAALAAESAAALILKFGFGLTGTSFFDVGGGVKLITLSAEDLESLAGGLFRLSGTLGHKNLLAAFYVLLLPVVSLEALHHGRVWWLIVIIPSLITLALTDSMTGWSAIVLVAVLALIHLRRFDYLAIAALIVLPLAAIALFRFGDPIFFRIRQLMAGKELGTQGWGTVNSRLEIWQISGQLIRQYPWTGIGRNNFLVYGKTFYGHAHNVFVMKIIEMGIPAGLAFAAWIVAVMARTWGAILRQSRRLAAQQQYFRTLGLWLGCLGFISMNLFDYNYSHFSLGPLFMAMLGILLTVALDLEKP